MRDDDIFNRLEIVYKDHLIDLENFHNLIKSLGMSHNINLIAAYIEKYPKVLRYIKRHQKEFDIQLHGWKHREYCKWREPELLKELKMAKEKVEKIFNTKITKFFPPGNCVSPELYNVCSQLGMEVVIKKGKHFWRKEDKLVLKSQYFLKRAKEFNDPNQTVLKTDVWNEARKHEDILGELQGRLYAIDIHKERLKQVKNTHKRVECKYGDIRDIPFKNNTFDLVLDFFTNNCVADYKGAIIEYRRVLKNNGKLLIYSWISNENKFNKETKEYRFEASRFKEILGNHFKIEETKVILKEYKDNLVEFICSHL